jgi:hypothetical protein
MYVLNLFLHNKAIWLILRRIFIVTSHHFFHIYIPTKFILRRFYFTIIYLPSILLIKMYNYKINKNDIL